MKPPRLICPACGSVAVDRGAKLHRCLNCGHAARGFRSSLDPVPEPEAWDGRKRVCGQIVKDDGAE